jgi:hypothetical protein
VGGNVLQFTISILGAIATIELMIGEQKLKGSVSQPLNLWRIEMHHHAIVDWLSTSRQRSFSALDFNKAKPTRG